MEKIKNSLIIASYLLLMAVFFAGGYALGQRGDAAVPIAEATPGAIRAVSVEIPEEAEPVTVYTIIMENSNLYLYSVTDGVNTEMARHKISETIFPASDIEMLKNGVTFDNLGDAQELLENFVS